MKEFQLQARCLVGPLSAPVRDEVRNLQHDHLDPLRAEAARLTRDGFTVWLFRYGPATGPSLTPYKLHLLETVRPDRSIPDEPRPPDDGVPATRQRGTLPAHDRHLRRA